MKPIIRAVSALAMAAIGVLHFATPDGFVRIVPAVLPAPLLLVYISGACEIAFGLGLLVPKLRFYAAIGLVLLYVAVFPANINMAVNHLQPDPLHPVPEWAAWARLPFQALFIAVAWWLRR
jgi:uncharacterized membrane protein